MCVLVPVPVCEPPSRDIVVVVLVPVPTPVRVASFFPESNVPRSTVLSLHPAVMKIPAQIASREYQNTLPLNPCINAVYGNPAYDAGQNG